MTIGVTVRPSRGAVATAAVLAVLAVTLIGCGGSHSGGSGNSAASSTPSALTRCDPQPNLSVSPTTIRQQADVLAEQGYADAARSQYAQILADPSAAPADRVCAARGLAALAHASAVAALSASAAASRSLTPQHRGAAGWDKQFERELRPLQNLIVPMLVVFAVLLGLSRFGTPVLVPARTPGPSKYTLLSRTGMRFAYCLGVVGMAGASCLGVLAVANLGGTSDWKPSWPGKAVLAGALLELTVGVALFGFVGRGGFRRRNWMISVALAVALAVVGWVIIGACSRSLTGEPWLLANAAVAAALGIVLTSRVRGLECRVRIEGHAADGSDDAATADAVRLRMQALGSWAPKGIELPQQTDVSTLPADATALLPDGTLAKAIFRVVQIFLPASPWRVTVFDLGDGQLGIAVQRNGYAAGSAVVDAAELGIDATDGGTDQPTLPKLALDTGAAAFVLCLLAERYGYLTEGLAGASRWRSVASQVLAADRTITLTEEVRQQLRCRAVASDAGNVAARLAFYHSEYRNAGSLAEARRYAEALESIVEQADQLEIEITGTRVAAQQAASGWEALQLRVLYNVAIAWFNFYLMCVADGQQATQPAGLRAWTTADSAAHEVKTRLEQKQPGVLRDLIADLRTANELTLASLELEYHRNPSQPQLAANHRSPHPAPALTTLLSAATSYDRACYLVAVRKAPDALRDLAVAATDPELRSWARTDPSMAWLREDADHRYRREFRRIVGDPVPTDFLQLPPWKAYAPALTVHGIRSATDLRSASPAWLSDRLGISPAVARSWQALAAVLQTTVDGEPAPVSIGFLLIEAGIRSRRELNCQLKDPASLAEELGKAAVAYDVDVPTEHDLARWQPVKRRWLSRPDWLAGCGS